MKKEHPNAARMRAYWAKQDPAAKRRRMRKLVKKRWKDTTPEQRAEAMRPIQAQALKVRMSPRS